MDTALNLYFKNKGDYGSSVVSSRLQLVGDCGHISSISAVPSPKYFYSIAIMIK